MGAREIRIEEVAEAGNFLALRSEDPEKYFLNGGWTIQWNGDYRVAGTTFTYKRTGNWENLTSPGPTVEPVWIQVRSRICWWSGCVAGRMGGTEPPTLRPSRAGLSCCGPSRRFPAIRGMGPHFCGSQRREQPCMHCWPKERVSSPCRCQLSLVPFAAFLKIFTQQRECEEKEPLS